jgi:hypothetical protein
MVVVGVVEAAVVSWIPSVAFAGVREVLHSIEWLFSEARGLPV